jgi:hypothetical protein
VRPVVIAATACVAGALVFVSIDRPWESTLSARATAGALRVRLKTQDRFDCARPSGLPTPTEPDWDYICDDVTHPARDGYFVDVSANRIVQIQSAG